MSRRLWTRAEESVMRSRYPFEQSDVVAAALGRPVNCVMQKAHAMGLRKTAGTIARIARERMADPAHPGRAAQFKPGTQPWNKGRKGSTGTHPNSRANHFKPGQLSGTAAAHVQPVGALRITSDGTLQRKMTRIAGALYRNWRPVHRLVWEAEHGPVPPGHIVVFKAGRRTTELHRITLDAVELIDRAENMRRNSFLTKYPPELARMVQLRGVLSRQINRKAREAAEQQENTAP